MYDYSVEIDKYNPEALIHCLQKLQYGIPDFSEWRFTINAGGIDYGIYLNFDIENKEIEICNQPQGRGEDYLDDVLELFEEEEEE